MKVLTLVLASDTTPEYLEFQSLWRTYMPAECYFYKAHPNLPVDAFLSGDTLMVQMEETFDTIYEKTLKAFEHFAPRLHEYDFVYRTNLSTFTHFPSLLSYCQTLPRTNTCAAVFGGEGTPLMFPGGSGILMTPDLVRRLLNERPNKVMQDDVTIGDAFLRWGVHMVSFRRGDYENIDRFFVRNLDAAPEGSLFSWRLKTEDRKKDVAAMRSLIARYVGLHV